MHQDNIESLWRKVTNTSADNCPMEFAKALVTSAVLSERERWQDVVYDGWKVFGGLDDQAVKRTSHQNVSDVLDALLRVLRSNAGAEPREASASGNLLCGNATKDE